MKKLPKYVKTISIKDALIKSNSYYGKVPKEGIESVKPNSITMNNQLIEIYAYCDLYRGSQDYTVYERAKQMLKNINLSPKEYDKAIDKICEILNL